MADIKIASRWLFYRMSFYVDVRGNKGPLSCMIEYPVISLVGIWRSVELNQEGTKLDAAACNMVMVSGKGYTPEPGFFYKIVIKVEPATVMKGFIFDGPLLDVVGKNNMGAVDCAFCYNPEYSYKICTKDPVSRVMVRTKAVLHSDVKPLYFRPTFDTLSPLDKDMDLPSLGDFLAMNPDFEIVLKHSGTVLKVAKSVLRRSSAFARMLDFKENIDPQSTDRIVIETPKYSDEVWSSAYFFMLHTRLCGDCIDTLIRLYEFGDEYLVSGLCSYVVQTLRERVEDGAFVGINPYIVPLLMMSVYWQSRDNADMDLILRLRELNHDCEIAVCNRGYTIMRYHPDFMDAWAKYLRYKEAWLGPIAAPETDPVHMMGPMDWPVPDGRKKPRL
jgi:hypothetical protein